MCDYKISIVKRNGFGELYFVNGDRYIGQWKNNLMDGEGEFISKEGLRFN